MNRIITPIFSIIIAITIYSFFLAPMYEDIKKTRTSTDTFNDAATKYEEFNKNLNKTLSIKRTQPPLVIERLDQLVPKSIDSAHVIADLETMAKNNSMLFGNISTDTDDATFSSGSSNSSGTNTSRPANEELQTTDISFDVIGTYEQLKSFLVELESSLTLLEIISLDFVSSNGLFEQFSMTVRAYALPKENN